MFVCVLICACCCCVVAILGGIFIAWGVRCSSVEPYRNETHHGLLSGTQGNTIRLSNNGPITIDPTFLPSDFTILTFTEISAPDSKSADQVRIGFFATESSFSLSIFWDFWVCPQERISVHLADTPLPSSVSLDLESLSGNLEIGNFTNLLFSDVDISNYGAGSIFIGELHLEGDFDLFSTAGSIFFEVITSNKFKILTAAKPIIFGALELTNGELITSKSEISGDRINLLPSEKCDFEVRTTSGAIDLRGVVFPTTATCQVLIVTSNSPINVILIGFSGSLDCRTTSPGEIFVTGHDCIGTRCSISTPGPVSHQVQIRTSSSLVNVTLVS